MGDVLLFHLKPRAGKAGKQIGSPVQSSYRKRTILLIFLVCLFKCFLAFTLELGNDEAYYWLYSLHLQWNYFDHPPFVALWIRLFTLNLSLDYLEGFIRLGSVIGSALASWFLFKATSLIHSERAGWFAAILYHASFYAGISAGLYILPDSPQMVFWTFSLWMIARIAGDEENWTNWIMFGIAAGLCIMSKVHGVFLWMGTGFYILLRHRVWLRKPQLYISLLITAVIISPIIFWNINNGFVTWRFHSQRVDIDGFAFNWRSFLIQFASQLTFNNPVNVFLVILAFVHWRQKKFNPVPPLGIYNFVALPLASALLLISIFRNTTLPHWSGPAYVSLLPLAATSLASSNGQVFPRILKWSLGIFVFVYLGWVAAVNWYPGTYGTVKPPSKLGRGDITLDMHGWAEAGKQFARIYHDDISKGLMPAGAPLVVGHWWGAHVEYYFAHPLQLPVIGLGETQDLHHYQWMNAYRKEALKDGKAYCILPSDENNQIPKDYFYNTEVAAVIHIFRSGLPAHDFVIFRMKGLKKEIPVVQ
ncbi:MAG: ArnT family glycosyltransferase [Flavisolibacter sp.]